MDVVWEARRQDHIRAWCGETRAKLFEVGMCLYTALFGAISEEDV